MEGGPAFGGRVQCVAGGWISDRAQASITVLHIVVLGTSAGGAQAEKENERYTAALERLFAKRDRTAPFRVLHRAMAFAI